MRLWALLLIAVLAACGAEAPAPPPPPPHMANPEDAANWAVRTLDPCALLSTPGEMASAHSCHLKQAQGRYVTVRVGGGINHFARSRSQLLGEGGLRVYMSYEPRRVICQFAVPLSPTQAVWVSSEWSQGSTVEQECAAARTELRSVVAKLRGNPAELPKAQGSLAGWTACELLAKAQPGPPPNDPGLSNMQAIRNSKMGDPAMADDCEWGDYRFSGVRLHTQVGTMPTTGEPLQLGDITAFRTPYDDKTCAVIFTQDTAPDGRANMVIFRGECGKVTETARKVRTYLTGPPPSPPPAPSGLGFAQDVADYPGAQECLVTMVARPDCRAHKPVPVPSGGAAIMQQAGIDLACTLLMDALNSVTGKDSQVAYTKDECVGMPADRSVEFWFKFDTSAKLPPWDAERLTIAGFPAMAFGGSTSRNLVMSDSRTEPRIGRLHLQAFTTEPQGVDSDNRPADPARLAMADRVAEAMLSRF